MARGLRKPAFTMMFVAAALVAAGTLILSIVHSREQDRKTQSKPAAIKPAGESWIQMSGGQMGVVDIPVTSIKGMTERQTCFVWRDTEYKSTSMQCPNDRASYSPDPPP